MSDPREIVDEDDDRQTPKLDALIHEEALWGTKPDGSIGLTAKGEAEWESDIHNPPTVAELLAQNDGMNEDERTIASLEFENANLNHDVSVLSLHLSNILGALQDLQDGGVTKSEALKTIKRIVTKNWGGVIDK